MLKPKVALITGSAKGIGRAIASRLAMDGFDIGLNYHTSDSEALALAKELESMGIRVQLIKADITKINEVKTMFDEIISSFGQIDVLVNNSGVFYDSILPMQKTEKIENMIDVNLKGYIYCTKIAFAKMMRNRKGKIINISSVSSIKGMYAQSVYSATKGAINSLTRATAVEAAPYGIQVNAVAPGFIETGMLDSLPEKERNRYLEMVPCKRFGTPEEVAELVSFLADDKVSYITGQVIVIDGGISI
jgi:3-oxoacyl-[acyl-carrier protein] reductase